MKNKFIEVYDPNYEHDTDDHIVKHKDDNKQDFWAVYNGDGDIVKVFYNEKKAKDYAEKNHDALMKNQIVAETVLVEMKLRTSPIPDGSNIPPYTTIFAHKDSIWVATPDEWKKNAKQITGEINQSLGITDNPMPVAYTSEGLYDVITERNIRDILVFIKYDDDLIYHRSAFKQSPQTSPLFKKVGKFLSQKFDLTTDEMSIFTMGVGQQGFTNDEVDPDSLKGALPTVGYHGTNIDALQSILKKGIMPQDSGNYGEIHTPGYIFFAADNSKILQSYAGQSAGGIWTPTSIPVTVHFKIPDQTKIRPDVDVAHDLYGGGEAKRINPDYKHLDFPDKARTPTKSKRPEKKWQHAEVFGYKGRIPASHIIGISMPKKYGGPNTSIEQVIENMKAWNVLKTKFDPKDIVYSRATWAGKTAEQIIKDETAEQENPTVEESMKHKKPVNEQPMSRPNNNPNFVSGIGVMKPHNQAPASSYLDTKTRNQQSGYATPVYPTAPGEKFKPTNMDKSFRGLNREISRRNAPQKKYTTPVRPTNALPPSTAPQPNYTSGEMNAMFNSKSNNKKPVNEEILKFNPEDPMSSEVLVQGYGTMDIDTLMKNVMGSVAELSSLRDGDPQSYRNMQNKLYQNGVFRAKLDALVGALDELQEIKSKGGKRSVNIQREASEQEQLAAMMGGTPQPQEQTMPIDPQQILRFVDDLEDRGQFTPEYADKIRRTVSSLGSARKLLRPHVLLQLMTLLTQGRK